MPGQQRPKRKTTNTEEAAEKKDRHPEHDYEEQMAKLLAEKGYAAAAVRQEKGVKDTMNANSAITNSCSCYNICFAFAFRQTFHFTNSIQSRQCLYIDIHIGLIFGGAIYASGDQKSFADKSKT